MTSSTDVGRLRLAIDTHITCLSSLLALSRLTPVLDCQKELPLSFIVDVVMLAADCCLGSGGPAESPVCPVSLGGDWLLFLANREGSLSSELGGGSFGQAAGFLSSLPRWSFP